MSNSFDDQLKKQWEERHFQVDEHHRNEMIALLETNRRKKGIFWWFSGLALAIALGGVMLYLNKENNSLPAPSVVPANSNQHSEEIANLSASANDPVAQSSIERKNEIVKTNAASLPSEKANATLKKNENPSGEPHVPASAKPVKKSVDKKVITASQKQTPKTTKKENLFSAAPNVNHTDAVVIPNTSPTIVSKAVAVVVLPDDADVMPSYAQAQRTATITSTLEPIFFSEVNDESEFSFGIKPASENYHAFSLFAEAGAGFIPGSENEYKSGWTFNAGGGLGYKTGEKTKVFLSGGYLLQNGGFDFERTSTVTQSGFGVRSKFNSLQPDKLHFIYSKLGIQYELKRNIFSLAGGVQWLYGAQGTYTIRTTDEFSQPTETSQYAWLNLNGMRRLLFNGEILYGYRIAPLINVRAGLKYYFSSIKRDDPILRDEGYSWNGQFSSITPSFTINYHLYGKR